MVRNNAWHTTQKLKMDLEITTTKIKLIKIDNKTSHSSVKQSACIKQGYISRFLSWRWRFSTLAGSWRVTSHILPAYLFLSTNLLRYMINLQHYLLYLTVIREKESGYSKGKVKLPRLVFNSVIQQIISLLYIIQHLPVLPIFGEI